MTGTPARGSRTAVTGALARAGIVVLGLVLAMASSMGWIIEAWRSSPLDAWGWLFMIAAAAWAVMVLTLVPRRGDDASQGPDAAGWPLLAGVILLALGGLLLDLRVVVAAAGLGFGWSLAWLLLGRAAGVLLLPSLLLALLGLPTLGFLLARFWGAAGLAPVPVLLLKAIVAAGTLLAGLLLLWRRRRGRLPLPGPLQSAYAVVLAAATAGLLVALDPPAFGPPLALAEDQWRFGDWYGAEIPTAPSERRLFGDSRRLSKRLYATKDGGRVSVLVVESDDVHDLHPPEYCLSGSGWVIGSADSGGADALPLAAAAAEISAIRDDQRLAGVYWFSSASRSTPDLSGLRLQSRLVPGEPFTLYLITAVEPARAAPRQRLADFLRAAPWLAAPRAASDDSG
jgi:hypothetical protein